ncbi:MAG: type II toxin-antitoxin system VapC family toxin, partial [Rhodothermales bacterium]
AVLEVLLRTPLAEAVEQRIFDSRETLHAPHLLDVEVAQVLRRYSISGTLDAERGHEALDDLADLAIARYSHEILLDRVWALRHNLTAYDGVYVALAEALNATLLTCDRRMASASGIYARIEIVG